MFIAHIPVGYLTTKFRLRRCTDLSTKEYKVLLSLGLIASVFPDFDMIYFYLIDNRQHLHHSYWTHLPLYWVAITALGLLVAVVIKNRSFMLSFQIVSLGIFGHLLMDSMAGRIRWFAPFSKYGVALVDIPSKYGWWVLNYLLHWSFVIELLLAGIAVYVFKTKKLNPTH